MLKKGIILVFVALFFINMASAIDLPSCSWIQAGDANADGSVDIADAAHILNFLFQEGESPACKEGLDINGDNLGDLTDAIFLLNYLFLGGAEPVSAEGGGIGFLTNKINEITRDGIEKVIKPSNRERIEFIALSDKKYSRCRIEMTPVDRNNNPIGRKEIIRRTEWESFPGFEGNQISHEPFLIILANRDFSGEEKDLLKVICTGKDGKDDSASMIVVNGDFRNEMNLELDRKNKNLKTDNFIPLQNSFVQDNPASSSNKEACCNVVCVKGGLSVDEIVGETCQQTTEEECDELDEQWPNKKHKSPDDLCQFVFGDVGGTVVKSVTWDETKECDEETNPDHPTCKGCSVESMSISYLPQHSYPAEIPIPIEGQYLLQTYPVNPADRAKLGHNEGLTLSLKSASENGQTIIDINPIWNIGWNFVVYAKLREGSDPDDCTEAQFVSEQYTGEIKPSEKLPDGNVVPQIVITITEAISGGMFLKNKLFRNIKLKDIVGSIPDAETHYSRSIHYPISSIRGCHVGSGYLCSDDYLSPREKIKIHKGGENPMIAWVDNPSILTSFSDSEETIDITAPGALNIDINKGQLVISIPSHFSFKKSFFEQRVFGAYPIIEDYKSERRFICQLEYIEWHNDPALATDDKKIQSNAPRTCKCIEQKWNKDTSEWKDISETPCG